MRFSRPELTESYPNLLLILNRCAEVENVAGVSSSQMREFAFGVMKALHGAEASGCCDFPALFAVIRNAIFLNLDHVNNNLYAKRASNIANNIGRVMNEVERWDDVVIEKCEWINQGTFDCLYRVHCVATMVSMQISIPIDAGEKAYRDASDRADEEIKNASEQANQKMASLKEKMQIDYVAVLGVFAALALGVNAGVGFSSSAVSAAIGVPAHEPLLAVIAIAGLVSFNLVLALLAFVWYIVKDGRRIPEPVWSVFACGNVLLAVSFVLGLFH